MRLAGPVLACAGALVVAVILFSPAAERGPVGWWLVSEALSFRRVLPLVGLGAAIGFAWHPRSWVALTLIAFFAICHGYAHGTELPKTVNPTDFAMGFVFATGFIHILGIGVGLVLQKTLQKGRLIRYLGALIALGGVYFLMV